MERPTVAIIGLGIMGLVALKNMLEEDFDATGFDSKEYVGGQWKFSEDKNTTSVTETTRWNTINYTSCYTDYPFPPGTDDFPTHEQLQAYLAGYCDKFSLRPHMKLGHSVKGVCRSEDGKRWLVEHSDPSGTTQNQAFDKVIIASGTLGTKTWPKSITGLKDFRGEIMHGQSFKRGNEFKDKRVLILGACNSAADCAVDLSDYAAKVYLSHRSGNIIIPRYVNGVPVEFRQTLRLQSLGRLVGNVAPSKAANIFNSKVLEVSSDAFGALPPEWRFNRLPPAGQQANPVVNDSLVHCLHNKSVIPVHNLRHVRASGELELGDGSILADVDTIIFCTGYEYDCSILPDDINPMMVPHPEWDELPKVNGRRLVDLYQGIYSLQYPMSLAFVGLAGFPTSQMPCTDLVTMGIAQVWKGNYKLPSTMEMKKEIDVRHAWLTNMAKYENNPGVAPHRVKPGLWLQFLHSAAGTGVNEKLGYGWQGWWYWVTNFTFCNSLMGGILSPHIWRLYDGRRKRWDGAKEAIVRTNNMVKSRNSGLQGVKTT